MEAARSGPVLARVGSPTSFLVAVHANHKRIVASAALIGGLTLLAKLFVAAREIAIASRFGISATVDAYQLALTITTWLPMMLTGTLSVVLVPLLMSVRAEGDQPYRAFVAELNGTVFIGATAIAVVTFVAAPFAAALLASDGVSGTASLALSMSRQMILVTLFTIVAGYLCARLQSRERFTYSAADAIPASAILLFAILPSRPSAEMLIIGTVLGYLLQLIFIGLLVGRSGDPPLGTIRLAHQSEAWSSLYRSLTLMALGQLLIMLTIPLDQAFAARLGVGSIAVLGYANRLITLFTGLGTIVVSRALLSVLSSAVVAGERTLARRQALQWSTGLFLLGAIIAAVFWLVAPQAVQILFQRGAFGSTASHGVARALQYGIVQLAPYFGGMALVQWHAATRQFGRMLTITALALILKLILNIVLPPLYGLPGIMIATDCMYLLTALLLFGSAVFGMLKEKS
ncbi:MAG TPA: lipid II flippase MurJ [Sphingomicrobium sp.]|nr:lipid II flippase MurJ [Sphingomicrobium sp.]